MFKKISYILLIIFLFEPNFYAQNKSILEQLESIDEFKNDSTALSSLELIGQNNNLTPQLQLELNHRIVRRANLLQKFDLATTLGYESIELASKNNSDSLEALFNKLLGATNYYMDRKKAAIPFFEKAAILANKNNFWELEASCYNNIGGALADVQQYEAAEPNLLKSIAIMAKHGKENANSALHTYRVLARLYSESGKLDKGEALYLNLIKKCQEAKDTAFLCENLLFYSEILSRRREVNKGIEMSSQALAFMRNRNNPHELLTYLTIHGNNLALNEQHKEAYDLVVEATYLMRTIFANNLEKEISDVEVKYKTAQIIQEKEIAAIKANEQKRLYLFSFFGILMLMGFGIYSWNQRKNTQQKATRLAELAEIEKIRFKEVIEAEEKERTRIAQELHDGLGQLLSIAKLNVASLEDAVPKEDMPNLERSLKIIDEACVEVRNISHNLMPSTLIRLGLIPTILELVNHVNAAKGVKIDFETNVETSLGQSLEISIYRVVQEIVNNMIKHAQANLITISITKSNKNLSISLKDDGVGFDTSAIKNSAGIGWKNIFSRIAMLDGRVKVESENQKGTSVFIELKLNNGK